MKRREFLGKFGKASLMMAGAGVFDTLWQGCAGRLPQEKWNVVFILADDMGWNQVRYHHITSFYETPNIDRIAAEGMYFTDAYAAAPVCSPTRASIMTGKYPARLHITDYIPGNKYPFAHLKTPQQARALPMEEVTLAEMFKAEGYVTGHFGKWHLNYDKKYKPGRPGDPGSQGFDVVLTTVKPKPDADPEKDAHHAIQITEHALKFIEDNKDRPFFAYVSHHVVHRPIMEQKDWVNRYKTKPRLDNPVHNPIMGAMIERMDWGIGKILDKLDELGLTQKTIVVFFSDNGNYKKLQDQAPLRGGKAMVYEGGIRVPMAVRWPGVIRPGSQCSVPVISNDFFPTFAELAGSRLRVQPLDGLSLVPLFHGGKKLARKALYWHYPHYHRMGFKPSGAIRVGDYKLIEWYEASLLGWPHQVDLYNIKEDIAETTNLAEEMPQKAKELREMLHAWRREVGAQEMEVNPQYDPARADLPDVGWGK
ncbi:MAG: sulfatase [candidate division KSB1 bacterium]|nr:sulfatase [candidate division KSB1 bacterium]